MGAGKGRQTRREEEGGVECAGECNVRGGGLMHQTKGSLTNVDVNSIEKKESQRRRQKQGKRDRRAGAVDYYRCFGRVAMKITTTY